jgi:hypothetical protein
VAMALWSNPTTVHASPYFDCLYEDDSSAPQQTYVSSCLVTCDSLVNQCDTYCWWQWSMFSNLASCEMGSVYANWAVCECF